MKLSTLISILQGTLKTNGDMDIIGMVDIVCNIICGLLKKIYDKITIP